MIQCKFNRVRFGAVKIVKCAHRKSAGKTASLCTLIGFVALSAALPALAQTSTQPPRWTPPTDDPKDFEGVWLPGGYANAPAATGGPGAAANTATPNGPPPEIGGLDTPPSGPGGPGGGPPGPPPGAAVNSVSGSTLSCTPVQRLSGAGGGMSNLWIQGAKQIVMISEEDMDIRKIYLNARHPKKLKPQPNGHSVGHWQGNTLVVDSIGFSKADGSDSGQHVVEHFRKEGRMLIDDAAITDADGKTRTQTFNASWRSDLRVYENVCEENFSRFYFKNGELIDETASD